MTQKVKDSDLSKHDKVVSAKMKELVAKYPDGWEGLLLSHLPSELFIYPFIIPDPVSKTKITLGFQHRNSWVTAIVRTFQFSCLTRTMTLHLKNILTHREYSA